MSEILRTFIALELDEPAKEFLRKIQTELKVAGADLKYTEKSQLHITVKFLGPTKSELVGPVSVILEGISKKYQSFNASIAHIGAFPSIERPERIIWAGLSEGVSESKTIALDVNGQLEDLGFKTEDREFKAHITLARVRTPEGKNSLKDRLCDMSSYLKPHPLKIEKLTFYQSQLTPQGPLYSELGSFSLRST